MLNFIVDKKLCTKCGQCVADCPMHIINMQDNGPAIAAADEEKCIHCLHCLAVCPSSAVSIAGFVPENSLPTTGSLPDAAQMEALITERRSIRQFKPENVDAEILQKLLDVTSYAPTGRNTQQVRFTVIDDCRKLANFRDELMSCLGGMVRNGKLPEGAEFVAALVQTWKEKHIDIIFRDAPHLLIASAPKNVVSPLQDCLIALTTFDLFAQTFGVGTLWCGLVKFAISDLMPEFCGRLGIPDDHIFGYAMAFGLPAVHYKRSAQRAPANIHRVENL
ncbi:MAG: nitroreductase family protein [Victivallaceae bacterium]